MMGKLFSPGNQDEQMKSLRKRRENGKQLLSEASSWPRGQRGCFSVGVTTARNPWCSMETPLWISLSRSPVAELRTPALKGAQAPHKGRGIGGPVFPPGHDKTYPGLCENRLPNEVPLARRGNKIEASPTFCQWNFPEVAS